MLLVRFLIFFFKNNGAQQLASEATVFIMLVDVNDEIPLFTEREQETVLEGEPIGTKVTQVKAIDKDGTFPNNQVIIFALFRFFIVGINLTDRIVKELLRNV